MGIINVKGESLKDRLDQAWHNFNNADMDHIDKAIEDLRYWENQYQIFLATHGAKCTAEQEKGE